MAALNIIGLIFNIVGVLMLWKFGLPPDVRRDGRGFLTVQGDDAVEKVRGKHYDRLGNVAMALIVLGFIFQLLAVVMPLFT